MGQRESPGVCHTTCGTPYSWRQKKSTYAIRAKNPALPGMSAKWIWEYADIRSCIVMRNLSWSAWLPDEHDGNTIYFVACFVYVGVCSFGLTKHVIYSDDLFCGPSRIVYAILYASCLVCGWTRSNSPLGFLMFSPPFFFFSTLLPAQFWNLFV